jgi:SAM-dependent methyltransferase
MSSALSSSRTSCPSCSGSSPLMLAATDTNRRMSKCSFTYYRCEVCGLIFLDPIPGDLGQYYPSDYYHVPESVDFLEATADFERYKLDILQRHQGSGSLLEIGPATGTFAWLAMTKGYDVQTIEMDARCSRFLHDVAGIPTINTADTCGALATLPCFDAVAMWHVIEHLPEPWETLQAVADRVHEGGVVLLAAPNPAAFGFRMLGKFWPHLDAPRHLRLIPARLLERWMASLGFTLESETTNDPGGRGWNAFGWEYAIRNTGWLPGRVVSRARRLGALFAAMVSPLEGREGAGAAYTMVFRKGGS